MLTGTIDKQDLSPSLQKEAIAAYAVSARPNALLQRSAVGSQRTPQVWQSRRVVLWV